MAHQISSTTEAVTRTEVLRRASALVPILKERALQTERLRRLPEETVRDLIASSNQRDRAFVVRLCMQAVNSIFDVSGGHALFLSESLQRSHRDTQAVAHRAGLMLETVGPLYGRVALSTPQPVDGALVKE